MKLSDNDTVCVYPNEEEIDKMVEDFTKELNISSKVKKSLQFGYQEGLYKMLEIWKQKSLHNNYESSSYNYENNSCGCGQMSCIICHG